MGNNLSLIREEALSYIYKQINALDIREKQILFVQCIMVFDKTFYDVINCSDNDTDTLAFYSDILHYGYPVFISLIYDPIFETLIGIPLSAINDERLTLCRSILYACKTIGWVDFLLENERCGNLKIYNIGRKCRIKFKKKYHWNEYLEKEYVEYYSKVVAHMQKGKYEELQLQKDKILDKMSHTVFVWLDNFMGYENDIDVEYYFNELAKLDLQQETEWDMFAEDDKFYDIDYSHYVETVADFAGYAIKHLYFASILLQSNPQLLLENLMYHCIESDKLIQLTEENRSLRTDDVLTLLSNFILNSRNKYLYESANVGCAPFVQISQKQYLFSMAGILDHPFIFMLENIHRQNPKEWDANAMHREKLFKSQLYAIFEQSGPQYICIQNNIKLISSSGKIITDIDAAVIDEATGEIALFQLKWQDHTATSTRSLLSKAKNYSSKASEWVALTRDWIINSSLREISSRLGIKERFIDKKKIYLFVLGRRHGNYSSDKMINDGCAWAQWYQLIASLQHLKNSTAMISDLFEVIQNSSPFVQRYIERPVKYKYGKYTILYGG